jgi:UDP-GlcNAc:undecaprenyl-phosphate GlcNAc-1-phosphate transferase
MISQAKYTLTEVLRHRWWIGGVAFGVALICTPVVRAVAYRRRIVDRPDDLLKPHAKPVAYLGGVAICVGLLTGLAAYVSIMPDAASQWAGIRRCLFSPRYCDLLANPLWNVIAIGAASVVITLVGLLDDLADVRPRTKVLGQVLAAAILLVGGVGNRMIMVFFAPFDAVPGDWVVLPLSVLMCLVTVIAACNATNLLDGLDGLCGGVTGIIAIGFLAVATWLAMWGGPSPGTDELRVVLCLAMAGAVFGFLPYNIPPASIFMGDAGSMLLGFFVATAMALFCAEGVARWFLAALAVFSLPILDTALAVVRRVLSKRNIFAGDRSHLYDQLVDRGMTVKQVVALFYVLALLAVGVGVGLAIFVRARYAVLIYAALLALIWAAFWKLGMIRPEARKPAEPARGAPPSD